MPPTLFETTIYKNVIEDTENSYWFLLAVLVGMPSIILREHIVLSILLICVSVFLIVKSLKIYFDFEILFFEDEGVLEINSEMIKFNEVEISWVEVEKVKFELLDYNGKRIFRGKGDNRPPLSIGIKNAVFVTTKKGDVFEFNFKIHSKSEYKSLEEFLWYLVKTTPFSFDNAKNIVKPKNYQEFQELKKYCK